MLRPVKLQKFYLAVPKEYGDAVARSLAKLEAVQLIKDVSLQSPRPEVELSLRYYRILDRANVLINSLKPFGEEKRKGFMDRIRDLMSSPKQYQSLSPSIEEAGEVISKFESELDKFTTKVDELNKEITSLKEVMKYIDLFVRYNVPVDIAGDYTHIFIRAGLLPIQNLSKLKDYLKPYNVVLNVFEGIEKTYFIVLAASNEYKEDILNYLSALNFEEIRFPSEFRGDPNEVKKYILERLEELGENAKTLYNELISFKDDLLKYFRFFKFLENVYTSVSITKNFSIFRGWVIKDRVGEVENAVREIVNENYVFETEDPHHGEGEMPPTLLKNPGLLNRFEILTRKRGIPNYFEIDPTPLFTALFLIMYGFMFGDVGEGIILIGMGLFLNRIKKPVLGLNPNALNSLGVILMASGFMAVIFGFLYGESLLMPFAEPLWISPIHDTLTISVYAIIFGLIQLVIGIILNIIVEVKNGEYLEAVLSWKGVVGLIYFVVGIYLAINFITGGLTLDVFVREDLLPFTIIEIILLATVYMKPTIENIVFKEGKSISITLIEGLQEFVEMFISYLTNSVSYIRLGAFAIAHGALGEAAKVFSGLVGFVPAYVLFNFLGVVIEGFASGIQSIRLLYYEFSTKFYRDEGVLFRALKL